LNSAPQNFPGESRTARTIPLPHLTRQKIKDAIVALSLATLCFIGVEFDLLFDYNRFFTKIPVTVPILLALMVNILGFALIAWLVMQVLHRFSNKLLHLSVHLLFLILLLLPLDFLRTSYFKLADYQIVAYFKQPVVIVFALVVLAMLVWGHQLVAKIAAVIVGIFSPLAFLLLVKDIFLCLGVIHLQQCFPQIPPPLNVVQKSQPRVIWIIFDETDYRLAFEQRPANVQLPEFDRLQQQSLSATSAYPPGDATIMSMPALILGQRISGVSYDNSCDLTITFAESGATSTWSGQPSVFSEARTLGANTAVVGWYIPYDHILGNVLNFCAWYAYPTFEPSRAKTFGAGMVQQICSLGEAFDIRHMFVMLHRDSLQASLSVVTNSIYGLTLLHLPAPHKPGVYLPDKDEFTIWGMPKTVGYFDNLMLADRELGELRHAMESSGEWNKTWIILSADHSWRESKLYDGKRDYRVPFLVKPPGMNEPITFSHQFNTVVTHDLILDILRRQIVDEQSLESWLEAHQSLLMPLTAQSLTP
jgi:hypothetical protein